MKNAGIALIIFIVALSIGFVVLQMQKTQVPVRTTEIGDSTIPEGTVPTTGTTPIDNSTLKMGGNSYADPKGIFTFLYPNDYKMDMPQEGQVRIYKNGATQRGQTEQYDGVLFLVHSEPLNNQTLEQWVDKTIETTTKDGTLEVIQPKKTMTLNGYPGISYATRGLGEANYIIAQKNPSSQNVVVVTMAISDPQNVGYQKEVDTMLSTLEILK